MAARRRNRTLRQRKSDAPFVPKTFGGAHLLPFLLQYLERLRLGCTLVAGDDLGVWMMLVAAPADPGPVHLDTRYGRRDSRVEYNIRGLDEARRARRTVVTERGGFFDFFIPVMRGRRVDSFLVCGPFRRSLFEKSELERLWTELSGRAPRASDPELLTYARGALQAALLEPKVFDATKRLLELMAALLTKSRPASVFNVFAARHVSTFDSCRATMQALATGLVDPLRSATLRDAAFGPQFVALGVVRPFSHVLAVTPLTRADAVDSLSEMVNARKLLQYGCELARELGNTVCGPLGDHGVFFLTSVEAANIRIDELAQRVLRSIEKHAGAKAHVGVSAPVTSGDRLPAAYDEAILSLQLALHEPRPVVHFGARKRRRALDTESPYRQRRDELRAAVSTGTAVTARVAAHAVFREILWRTGGVLDAVRAHSDGLLLDLVNEAGKRSVIDAQSLRSLEKSCLGGLQRSRTVTDVDGALSRGAELLAEAVQQPFRASAVARIETSRRYIAANCEQPLHVTEVARRAGFSRNYFSTLFRRFTGQRFEAYLIEQRLERAKELLLASKLPVSQVGRDAGFSSAEHFSRVFHKKYGKPPAQFRRA